MKVITEEAIAEIVKRHGFDKFLQDLMQTLKEDYCNWEIFTKVPRPAMHVPDGVLELMPICDNKNYYTFKYVNCHPRNILSNKLTVVATGQLSEIKYGYPLMFSEMTVLTAFRTAANAALATDLMARKNSQVWALIGTGAQSEFQTKAMLLVRDIKEIRFFDIDSKAMDKYEHNISALGIKFIRCHDAEEATKGADIITTCTACKANVDVIKDSWVHEGVHINALGGDTIGKTELELNILDRCRIVVEYFEQAYVEGEIQRLSKDRAEELAYRELFQLMQGIELGRTNGNEITLFDSVGIGLEDYSALRFTYDLALKYNIGQDLNLVPALEDPKNLFSLVN